MDVKKINDLSEIFTCKKCQLYNKFLLKQAQQLIKLNSKIQYYCKNSVFAGFTITNLVNDMLDLAKIEQKVGL